MGWFLVAFAIGAAVGWKHKMSHAPRIQQVVLALLLLSIGAGIGADSGVLLQLPRIGGQAALLALGGALGSLLVVLLVLRPQGVQTHSEPETKRASYRKALRSSALCLCELLAGVALGAGLHILLNDALLVSWARQASLWCLYAMLLLVAMDLAQERRALWAGLRAHGWRMLLLPVCVLAGSVAGTLPIALLCGLPANHGAGIGVACGWYSLSGALFAEIDPALGTLAYLANVLRETLALLTAPWMVTRWGGEGGAALGGATAMDTTLSVIAASGGSDAAVKAFCSGFLLTLVIPVILPFCIGVG